MGRCDLPVGTHVVWTNWDGRSHRAMVCGYDMGRTKYRLSVHQGGDRWSDTGLWWAFDGNVVPVDDELSNVTVEQVASQVRERNARDRWRTLLAEDPDALAGLSDSLRGSGQGKLADAIDDAIAAHEVWAEARSLARRAIGEVDVAAVVACDVRELADRQL